MKHFILFALVMLCSCLTVNAQESVSSSEKMTLGDVSLRYGRCMNLDNANLNTEMANSQSSVVVNPEYQKKYKHAKTLRTVGIVTTAVGGTATALMSAAAISVSDKDSVFGFIGGVAIGWYTVCCCTPVLAGGIVMWAVGNHKMKKIRLASEGAGLAYTF